MAAQGLSITEIAAQTGFKRTAIWVALKSKEKAASKKQSVPYARWRKGSVRTGAKPPYGFCFLQGEVVPEPKEYAGLLVIHRLWNQQSSISAIVKNLKEKGIKSRAGKAWRYGVIKSIVGRMASGAIVNRGGKLFLSGSFLAGVSPKTKGTNNKGKKK